MPITFTEEDFLEEPTSFTESDFAEEQPAVPALKTGILDIGVPEWIARKLGLGPAPETPAFISPSPLPTGGFAAPGVAPVEPTQTMLPVPLPKTPITAKDIPSLGLPPEPAAWTAEAINQALGFGEFVTSPVGVAGAAGPVPALGIAAGITGEIAGEMPELAARAGRAWALPGTPAEERAQATLGVAVPIVAPVVPMAGKAIARAIRPPPPTVPRGTIPPPAAPLPPVPEAEPPIPVTAEPVSITKPARPMSVVRPQQWYGPDGPVEEIVEVNIKKGTALVRYKGADPTSAPVEIKKSQLYQRPVSPAKSKQVEMEMEADEKAYQDQERSAIDEGVAGNREAGLTTDVEVRDSLPEGDPFAKNFEEQIATIRNGKILINRANFLATINEVPEAYRNRFIRSLFSEEGIHDRVERTLTDTELEGLFNDLSFPEQRGLMRSYTGQWSEITNPKDPRYISRRDFGHEYMRRLMQWAMKTDVREVIGAKGQGMEWIKQKGIDLGLRAIDQIRKTLKTETAANIGALLDKAQGNLQALSQVRTGPGALMGERQRDLEEKARTMLTMPVDQLKAYPGGATKLAWDIGASARTPEDVAVLRSVAEDARAQIDQLRKSGKIIEAGLLAGRQPAEAYEYATGVKLDGTPKWESLESLIPGYRPPVPDAKYLAAKGLTERAGAAALRRKEPRKEPYTLEEFQSYGRIFATGPDQLDSLVEMPDGTEIYVPNRRDLRAPHLVERNSPMTVLEDAFERYSRGKYDMSFPAALRRKPTPEERGIQPTFALPPGVSRERPTAGEIIGYRPPSLSEATDEARKYLETADVPSFEQYAKEVESNLGPGSREILERGWEESVWESLMTMPGKRLERLRDRLGVRERITGKVYAGGTIADLPKVEETAKVAEPKPVTAEAWLATKARRKVMQRHQAELAEMEKTQARRRLEAISAIGEKLLEQTKLRKRADVDRPKIFTPDIGWQLEQKGREPAWMEFDEKDTKKPGFGIRLVSGSRVKGEPDTVTHRVTFVRDNLTGRVEGLSTYEERLGRGLEGVIRIFDPEAVGRKKQHVSIGTLLSRKVAQRPRYTVLASTMVTDPVRNFRQTWPSEMAWREDFADTAYSEASARVSSAVEAAALPETAIEPTRPALRTLGPMTDAEAGAIFGRFSEEIGGKVTSVDDTRQLFETLILNPKVGERPTAQQIQVANALDKAWRKIREEKLDPITKRPLLTPEEAMSALFDWIYENTREGKTREGFVTEALRRFAPPREPVAAPGLVIPPERVRTAEDVVRQVAEQRARYAGTRLPFDQWMRERGPFSPSTYTEEGRPTPPPPFAAGRRGTQLPPQEPRVAPPLPETLELIRKQAAAEPEGEVARKGPGAMVMRRAAKSVGSIFDDMVREPLRAYSEWMTDKIYRVGGIMSKQAATVFAQMIDREKELYGYLNNRVARLGFSPAETTAILDAARRLGFRKPEGRGLLDMARKAAGRPSRATTWLHGLENITDRTAVSRTVGMMERTIQVPSFVNDLAILARASNFVIGKLYESVTTGFQASGKFQRNLTALGYDIIRQGSGQMWENWTNGLAVANGFAPSSVKNFFRKWKKILDDPTSGANALDQVNQDFARKMPNVVTHVRAPGLGEHWRQMVHSDLFNYLETAARRSTHIKSFRERFPNDPAGRKNLRALDRAVRAELDSHTQESYNALIRTLQGHPTDNYSKLGFMAPGRAIPETFRFLNNTLGTLFARSVLTGQMFVQPGENIAGSTPVFLGYRNYAEGLARVKQLYAELEQAGDVNRVMYDWSFDPVNPIRSSFRIMSNSLSAGFFEQFLNELQEASAAATARVVSERIATGSLSDWEKRMLPQTFRIMGFNPGEVGGLMRGNTALLAQFERKAASFLTSGNRAISEGSRIGANRLMNSLFRFQAYPMMKTNQLRRVMGNMIGAWKKGTARDRLASTEMFGRFMFGNSLQGALTVGIAALAYEGWYGARIKAHEATDEPFQFVVESFFSSISGPLYLILRGAKYKGIAGIGEQALRMLFPYSVLRDSYDMAHGQGQYKDLDTFDRIGRFISQKAPGTRAISLGLSSFGLSQKDLKLESSIRAFYRWRRDELGFKEQEDFLNEDTRKAFRTHMKTAVEAMKRGDFETYVDAVGQATGEAAALPGKAKPKQAIASSLRARKILKTPDGKPLNADQIEALRDHIGSAAVDRLQYFDMMLENAAEGVLMPRYD